MSRRKKKLYARKYQPWWAKKTRAAAAMEHTLLTTKPVANVGDLRLRSGDAIAARSSSKGDFRIK